MRFRILLLLIVVVFESNNLYCQVNLVPNPSFEDYSSCPNNLGESFKANNWNSYLGSADYFNVCASVTSAQIPRNEFGFQYANSGNAYGGIITYYNSDFYREVLGTKLQNQLTIGQKYFFSFMTCRGSDNAFVGYNTNKLGVKLSKTDSYTVTANSYTMLANNFSNSYSNVIINDTMNWQQIKGSFIADSAYKYLMIGNFFDDSNTTIINQSSGIYAYYYIDDVCLSTDSLFAHNYTTNILKLNNIDKICIFPNPTNNKLFIENKSNLPIKIENSQGIIIYEKKSCDFQTELNVSNWPVGIYFLRCGNYVKKIIIN